MLLFSSGAPPSKSSLAGAWVSVTVTITGRSRPAPLPFTEGLLGCQVLQAVALMSPPSSPSEVGTIIPILQLETLRSGNSSRIKELVSGEVLFWKVLFLPT